MHAVANLASLLLPPAADASAPAQIPAGLPETSSPFALLLAHVAPAPIKTDLRATLQAGVAATLPKLPAMARNVPSVAEAPTSRESAHDVPVTDAVSAILTLTPMITPVVTDVPLPNIEVADTATAEPVAAQTPDTGFVVEQPEPATTQPVAAPEAPAHLAPAIARDIPAHPEIGPRTVPATTPRLAVVPQTEGVLPQPAVRAPTTATASHVATEVSASKAEPVNAARAPVHASLIRPIVAHGTDASPAQATTPHAAIAVATDEAPKPTPRPDATKMALRATATPVATMKSAAPEDSAASPVQRILPRTIAAQPIEAHAARIARAAQRPAPKIQVDASSQSAVAPDSAADQRGAVASTPAKAAAKVATVPEPRIAAPVNNGQPHAIAEHEFTLASTPVERAVRMAVRAAIRIDTPAPANQPTQPSPVQRAPIVADETAEPTQAPAVVERAYARLPKVHATAAVLRAKTTASNTHSEPVAVAEPTVREVETRASVRALPRESVKPIQATDAGSIEQPTILKDSHPAVVPHTTAPATPRVHAANAKSAEQPAILTALRPAVTTRAAEPAAQRVHAQRPEIPVEVADAESVEHPRPSLVSRQTIAARATEPAIRQLHAPLQPAKRVEAGNAEPVEPMSSTGSRPAVATRAAEPTAPHVQAAVQSVMPVSLRAPVPVQAIPAQVTPKATAKAAISDEYSAGERSAARATPDAPATAVKPQPAAIESTPVNSGEPVANAAPVNTNEPVQHAAPITRATVEATDKPDAHAMPELAQATAAPATTANSGPVASMPGHATPAMIGHVEAAQPAQPAQPANTAEPALRLPTHTSHDARAPEIEALAVRIAAKSAQGNKRFDIRLDPPELGRIDVRLDVDDTGRASAQLTADKPQTLDLLQRDHRHLERALKDAGLDLGGMSFSLKGEERQHDARAMARPQTETESAARGGTPIASIAPLARWSHVTDARVDIRV